MLEVDIVTVLGGTRALGRAVHNQLDLADLIASGIPSRAAESLRRRLRITEQELASSLGVSAKTLQRAAGAPNACAGGPPLSAGAHHRHGRTGL